MANGLLYLLSVDAHRYTVFYSEPTVEDEALIAWYANLETTMTQTNENFDTTSAA